MNVDKIIKEATSGSFSESGYEKLEDSLKGELQSEVIEDSSPEEIAESYVNGNISWVKEQVEGNKQLQRDVFDYILQAYAPEIGNDFIRNIVLGE